MKSALQEWLSPEDEEEEDSITSEPAEDFDSDTDEEPKSNYSLSTKPQKKTQTESLMIYSEKMMMTIYHFK